MKTEYIRRLLRKFDDQHLANLQCAAEDGTLVYHDSCHCLLHHFRGNYTSLKVYGEDVVLARLAEQEFYHLGRVGREMQPSKSLDQIRRDRMLPLIHAEWALRTAERDELARQEALCAC